MTAPAHLTSLLCLHCGLCCDGTLFRAVELRPDDDAVRLKNLGLPIRPVRRSRRLETAPAVLRSVSAGHQFSQPCHALGTGCRCQIYPDRPTYCRQFECRLFQRVRGEKQTATEALRLIRSARRRAATVRRLLTQLGDHDTNEPLALRFRRMRKRMESDPATTPNLPEFDRSAAQDLFRQLSLAVHRLNLLLGERFYPDPGQADHSVERRMDANETGS